VFLSDEDRCGSPSRILNESSGMSPRSAVSGTSALSKNKVPRDLDFGDLIEKSFGMSSFDLKREMEILRKVDEEVTTVKFKQRHDNEDFPIEIVNRVEEKKDLPEEIPVASAS
jgi:hypothetical protein